MARWDPSRQSRTATEPRRPPIIKLSYVAPDGTRTYRCSETHRVVAPRRPARERRPRAFVFIGAVLFAMATNTATATEWNKTLLSKSPAEQERILHRIINSAGYPCPKVTTILLMGGDHSAGYWAAACSDGGNWMVQVKNDPNGTTAVTPCALMKLAKIDCWKKLSHQ